MKFFYNRTIHHDRGVLHTPGLHTPDCIRPVCIDPDCIPTVLHTPGLYTPDITYVLFCISSVLYTLGFVLANPKIIASTCNTQVSYREILSGNTIRKVKILRVKISTYAIPLRKTYW